jgi:rare lipoprotein A
VLERKLYQSFVILAVACGPSAPAATPEPVASSTTPPPPTPTASATATASVDAPEEHFDASHAPIFEKGIASWYGAALAGHHTASGEIFDPALMTAAHRTLKLGTMLEVKRVDNGRIVHVKVNDRGPMSHRFVIDLSSGAAKKLGMLKMGVAPVELRILK